jgi:light-regulated signal transduction histidine kinase (bacteriophytochrome)
VKTDYGKLKMDSIRMVISELRSVKKAALIKNSASINSLRNISQSLIILSTVIIIGILIFLFIYVKPLFKRISKNTQEIERKNKELEHFAYITSHDLKEPSRTIAGFITAFEEDFEDRLNDESKYYLDHIKSASQRMNDMISTILSFSNLGKSEKFEKISLNEILAELQEDLKLLLIESSANIAYANLPELYAKRNLIKLLFQNLILNAIKFRKKNVLPKIEIIARDTKNHFEFSVKDNGIGIAPDHQDKIFNFFTKLHLRSEYEGYGIGLSFCKKIAEIHQGQIGVFSKLGQGSTFTIKIHKNLQHENL